MESEPLAPILHFAIYIFPFCILLPLVLPPIIAAAAAIKCGAEEHRYA